MNSSDDKSPIGSFVRVNTLVFGKTYLAIGKVTGTLSTLPNRLALHYSVSSTWPFLIECIDGITLPCAPEELTFLTKEEYEQEVLEYELQR